MKYGDLFEFGYINGRTRDINCKSGIYLGERPLKRSDGKIINNFAIQLFGETTIRICDEGLKRWMMPLDNEKNEAR